MELCSDGHEEVCYDGKHCPACVALQENDELGAEVDELKGEIKVLESNVDSLQKELGECG